MQIGHRKSVDLDLFGIKTLDGIEISRCLSTFDDVWIMGKSTNIFAYSINGVKVDFVNYPYPWIDEPLEIAVMKINAITGRGTRKDFVDLFYLLKEYDLTQILSFYEQKFTDGNLFLALRSLIYFDDADLGQVDMIKEDTWKEMKQNIIKHYQEYIENNNLK